MRWIILHVHPVQRLIAQTFDWSVGSAPPLLGFDLGVRPRLKRPRCAVCQYCQRSTAPLKSLPRKARAILSVVRQVVSAVYRMIIHMAKSSSVVFNVLKQHDNFCRAVPRLSFARVAHMVMVEKTGLCLQMDGPISSYCWRVWQTEWNSGVDASIEPPNQTAKRCM